MQWENLRLIVLIVETGLKSEGPFKYNPTPFSEVFYLSHLLRFEKSRYLYDIYIMLIYTTIIYL